MDIFLDFHYQGKTSGKNSKKRHAGKGFKTNGAYAGIINVATEGVNFELKRSAALEIPLTEKLVFVMKKR